METTVPIEERHRVLIAAAVAAVCGENARILGIAPARSTRNAWTVAGRVTIHRSHRPSGTPGSARLLAKQDPGATTK
ncbi:MAG TPA: hypothetical protein VHA11_09325 [Bryobacteraceae bacterium]|nr:hypothetical protein [Bryobacteraceae bacterium]